MADSAKRSSKLTFSEEKEAKVENYDERPYFDALTPEHKAVLEEAHQLPPKPSPKTDS